MQNNSVEKCYYLLNKKIYILKNIKYSCLDKFY